MITGRTSFKGAWLTTMPAQRAHQIPQLSLAPKPASQSSVRSQTHSHEAELLALDTTAARQKLGWADRLDFSQAVEWTVEWTKSVNAGIDPRTASISQITQFETLVNQ